MSRKAVELSVLFVSTNPRGGHLDDEVEFGRIKEALQPAIDDGRVILHECWEATSDKLFTAFLEHTPSTPSIQSASTAMLIYISCHGSRSSLQLQDKSGNPSIIVSTIFSKILNDLGCSIPLVIFSACESSHLAERSVNDPGGVRTGIGFEGKVWTRGTRDFSYGFFSALVRGRTIRRAFTLAKRYARLRYVRNPKDKPRPVIYYREACDSDLDILLPSPHKVLDEDQKEDSAPIGKKFGRRHVLGAGVALGAAAAAYYYLRPITERDVYTNFLFTLTDSGRSILMNACTQWVELLTRRQVPEGGFTSSRLLEVSGWNTAQQLTALLHANRAADILHKVAPFGNSARERAAKALDKLQLQDGWGTNEGEVNVPATAWASIAYVHLWDVLRDAGSSAHATAACECLLNAQMEDGGFSYHISNVANRTPQPYSTMMALWALSEYERIDTSFITYRVRASQWIRSAFTDHPAPHAREIRDIPGLSEQAYWILRRERGGYDENSDGLHQIAKIVANNLLGRCNPLTTFECSRQYLENDKIPFPGNWNFTVVWFPWSLLATVELCSESLGASLVSKLISIAEAQIASVRTFKLDTSIDYAAFIVAGFLFAASELLAAWSKAG